MVLSRLRAVLGSLRVRLTLWNTVVLAALVLVTLLALREGLRFTLYQMVDEFIGEELDAATIDLPDDDPDAPAARLLLNHRAAGHPRRGLFVQLFTIDGRLLWSSVHAPGLEVAFLTPAGDGQFFTVGDYRFVHRRIAAPGGGRVMQVGCSLRHANHDLTRFTRLMIGVGCLALLLAPLGGFLLAGRATRPLALIIATTARLQPDHLKERLPIRDSHDELDQLSQTINGLLDRIARYIEQMREFTANAAHELRSPLTAMYSGMQVALNAERSAAEYQEVLSDLLEEASGLRLLVNRLLLLAEGDVGQVCNAPKPVQLDEVVRRSAEMFQGVAEVAGVELQIERLEPLLVPGDAGYLWQVINNLLDNATKYTPAPGRVRVTLVEEAGAAVLRVADSGAGIAAEDLPHVFERFYRGDKGRGRQGNTRGTGLGLSICQTIVAAHQGTIEITSVPGRGTEVTVRLPGCTHYQPPEVQLAPPEPSPPAV